MSTRSHIAYTKDKGEIVSTYCHSDGYLAYNGSILYAHYDNREQAKALVDSGYLSSLSQTLEDCDRAHDDKPTTYNNEYSYMLEMNHDIFIEYIYLFKDGKWFVSMLSSQETDDGYNEYSHYHTKFKSLRDELIKEGSVKIEGVAS